MRKPLNQTASNLAALGFSSYAAYLESPLWARIRDAAYHLHGQRCFCCGGKAECIHHLDYELATLEGARLDRLAPLCHRCHHTVEFRPTRDRKDERKRKPEEALATYLTLRANQLTRERDRAAGRDPIEMQLKKRGAAKKPRPGGKNPDEVGSSGWSL